MANFYITTTIPYVNADPHIGFALEIIQADTIARYHRLIGDNVFHNFGSDEHGIKIYEKAIESKKDPQTYVNEYAKKFKDLKEALNIDYDAFIRTTDPHHIKAAQEFWRICKENGDIYLKNYKTKYCVGCEMEKTDSELIDGFCEFHPGKELIIIEEENYFFKFSKYEKPLLEFYEKNPHFVVPQEKFNEIKQFVKEGLEDFSVSRLKGKMPWGVPVPDDENHVMYVWFDALVNYISTLGWPEDTKKFNEFWPGMQTAGKDNLRQQSAIWQAMLMSAKLPNSTQIFIHGFLTVDGQRISKTIGNVINPLDIVKTYGTDPLRYYLLAKVHPWDDSDFSWEKLKNAYNADLANGLGNLVARVAKLAEKHELSGINKPLSLDPDVANALDEFRFDYALETQWQEITKIDIKINETKPWTLPKEEAQPLLEEFIQKIRTIAYSLQIFLPEVSKKILDQFTAEKIVSQTPLFPRIV